MPVENGANTGGTLIAALTSNDTMVFARSIAMETDNGAWDIDVNNGLLFKGTVVISETKRQRVAMMV